MNVRQILQFSCVFIMLLLQSPLRVRGGESTPVEKSDSQIDAKSPEQIIRERFLLAYQTAQNSDRKAETADMLRGLKERESHRLLTGILADREEQVRLRACKTIAATTDPTGYFVKPLMGALSDTTEKVRIAASEALSSALIKADAIKALAFAMMSTVGQLDTKSNTEVVDAYDKALEKLSGQRSPQRGARAVSSFWIDYWKKNEEALRAADKIRLAEVDPVRPEGLPRDSFDKEK